MSNIENVNQNILDIGYTILNMLYNLNKEYGYDHQKYEKNTEIVFKSKDFESKDVIDALIYRIKHQHIRHFSYNYDYEEILKRINNKKVDLIKDLRNGLILISDFGKSYISKYRIIKISSKGNR